MGHSRCSVPGCKTKSGDGLIMRRFPIREELRMLWLKDWPGRNVTVNTAVCENHFEPNQFERIRVDGKKKLKFNAVPTFEDGEVPLKISGGRLKKSLSDSRPNVPADHRYYASRSQCENEKGQIKDTNTPSDVLYVQSDTLDRSISPMELLIPETILDSPDSTFNSRHCTEENSLRLESTEFNETECLTEAFNSPTSIQSDVPYELDPCRPFMSMSTEFGGAESLDKVSNRPLNSLHNDTEEINELTSVEKSYISPMSPDKEFLKKVVASKNIQIARLQKKLRQKDKKLRLLQRQLFIQGFSDDYGLGKSMFL